MANLIDTSYFKNEIAVAQADYEPVAAVLTDMITKYESLYLSTMLGTSLHREFKEGLAAPEPIEQRWIDLRDGVEFYDSVDHYWRWGGFVNEEKISPIANYVYFFWLQKESQLTTGSGEGVLQGENIIRFNPVMKQVNVWNQMVEMNFVLLKYLLSDWEAYGDIRCTYLKDNLLCPINEFNL